MSPEAYAKFVGGIWGFLLGAGVAMLIGFQVAGWATAGTTKTMNDEAVLASHAGICVAQFMRGADFQARMKEFQQMDSYKKSEFIEKGGWDKMPGQETATWGVASACVARLDAQAKPAT